MERVIRINNSGDIACNDTIICSKDKSEIGKGLVGIYDDWKVTKPEYYRYKDDDSILEMWNDELGMIISGSLNGIIATSFTDEKRVEITYKEAMKILSNEGENYSNKDLMSRVEDELKQEFDIRKAIEESKGNSCCEIAIDYGLIDDLMSRAENELERKNKNESTAKQNNNGGATDYYALPKDANTLQDLIEHRNMNGSVKDIFKACYRLGIKTEDELRDANKMAYYSLREIGRITGRKDYITIAKELMGSQAIEKE